MSLVRLAKTPELLSFTNPCVREMLIAQSAELLPVNDARQSQALRCGNITQLALEPPKGSVRRLESLRRKGVARKGRADEQRDASDRVNPYKSPEF